MLTFSATTLSKQRARELHKELSDVLTMWNNAYYNTGRPVVADVTYDLTMAQLKAIERDHPETYDENSPANKVGH